MLEYLSGLPECGLWCDGVWGLREYVVVGIPVIFTILTSAYSAYENDSMDETFIVGVMGASCGLLFSLCLVLVPFIGIGLIGFIFLVLGGVFIGKTIDRVFG
jgi:hypothetical protein